MTQTRRTRSEPTLRITLATTIAILSLTGCLSSITHPIYEWNLDQVSGAANVWRIDACEVFDDHLCFTGTRENRSGRLVEWRRRTALTVSPDLAQNTHFEIHYRRGGHTFEPTRIPRRPGTPLARVFVDEDVRPPILVVTGPAGESWTEPLDLRPALTRRIAAGVLIPITFIVHSTFVVIDGLMQVYIGFGSAQGARVPL